MIDVSWFEYVRSNSRQAANDGGWDWLESRPEDPLGKTLQLRLDLFRRS
jgi:hypothetical protein